MLFFYSLPLLSPFIRHYECNFFCKSLICRLCFSFRNAARNDRVTIPEVHSVEWHAIFQHSRRRSSISKPTTRSNSTVYICLCVPVDMARRNENLSSYCPLNVVGVLVHLEVTPQGVTFPRIAQTRFLPDRSPAGNRRRAH